MHDAPSATWSTVCTKTRAEATLLLDLAAIAAAPSVDQVRELLDRCGDGPLHQKCKHLRRAKNPDVLRQEIAEVRSDLMSVFQCYIPSQAGGAFFTPPDDPDRLRKDGRGHDRSARFVSFDAAGVTSCQRLTANELALLHKFIHDDAHVTSPARARQIKYRFKKFGLVLAAVECGVEDVEAYLPTPLRAAVERGLDVVSTRLIDAECYFRERRATNSGETSVLRPKQAVEFRTHGSLLLDHLPEGTFPSDKRSFERFVGGIVNTSALVSIKALADIFNKTQRGRGVTSLGSMKRRLRDLGLTTRQIPSPDGNRRVDRVFIPLRICDK